MAVEAATFIADLQQANPGAADLRSEGDDHLRLIKKVLQDSFPTSSKAWYNPNTASKTVDFTVVAGDMNKTFLCDTTAGIINLTLPSLAAGDAGWECFLIKTNTGTSPVLVKPAAGTISSGSQSGLAACRRCIPNVRTQCLWTGSAWIISRAEKSPLGSLIPLTVAGLPVGYEYPNGQTLGSASTNYPEFYAANGNSGVTLDKRGRGNLTLDNLGGAAAGHLAGGFITGTAIGNVGGVDNIILATGNLPSHWHGINWSDPGHTHSYLQTTQSGGPFLGSGGFSTFVQSGATTGSSGTGIAFSGAGGANTTQATGNGTSISNLGPSMMVNEVLVVE